MYNYEKVASSSLKEAKDILRDIYEENPKHWPYGLYPEQMDGGLYLVREASTKEPVGFVGWQERIEDFKKVGYYSVGIKKAHRRSGYAKAAVKKLIQEKSARVDRVKALIIEGNSPSVGLAKNLDVDIDMQKSAGSLLRKALPGGLAGIGLAAGENAWMGYEPGSSKINLAMGALTGGLFQALRRTNPKLAYSLLAGGIGKSIGIYGVDQLAKARKEQSDLMDKKLETAENYRDMASLLSPYEEDPNNPGEDRIKPLYAAGGLAAGALGTGAVLASVLNALRDKNKITLENKEFKDPNVLSVDIPKDKVSDKFYTNLNRDMLFSTPEEKREKLKDLLEDMNEPKEAMEKKAFGLLARGAGLLGKGLFNAGRLGGKAVRGIPGRVGEASLRTGRALNPLNKNSIYFHPRFKRSLAQYGIGHGSLYGLDAIGASKYIGDKMDAAGLSDPRKQSGNWGNRFGKFLFEPVTDAAKDFRQGNYGAGVANALYAPIHFGLNAATGAGLGKHLVKNTGRLVSGGGKLLAGKGSQQLSNLGSRYARAKGSAPSSMQQILNPMLSKSTGGNPMSTSAQLIGQKLSDVGRSIYGSGLSRGYADQLLTPMLQGYGRLLGGNNAFGRGLGNIATAAGTISMPALRQGLLQGGNFSRNLAKNKFLMPASLAASIGVPAMASPYSRENRMYAWEAEQAAEMERKRRAIADYENNIFNNPDMMRPAMNMLFGTYDGGGSKWGT